MKCFRPQNSALLSGMVIFPELRTPSLSIIPTERRVQQCTIEDANSKLLDVVTIANGDAVGREFETVFR